MNRTTPTVPASTAGRTFLTVIMILMLIILFVVLVFAGYYLIAECGTKKSFFDYLFDMEVQPCLTGLTPKQESEIEKQDYRERKKDQEKEVFHIGNQIYAYDEAECKCNAFGAHLATKDQIIQAFNEGSEFSTYGWVASDPTGNSDMAQAYFLLQPNTFYKRAAHLPREKWFDLGVPGVNGGQFSKSNRFGVNCFGVRPKGTVERPIVPPPTESQVCKMTMPYEASHKTKADDIAPFNPSQWSVYDEQP